MQKDSWAIDYQATKNALDVARQQGASHFVLLSAICVQKPLLEFQHAKLKFEAALQEAGDITYSIVRPTAFFKSLAGQVLHLPFLAPVFHSTASRLIWELYLDEASAYVCGRSYASAGNATQAFHATTPFSVG